MCKRGVVHFHFSTTAPPSEPLTERSTDGRGVPCQRVDLLLNLRYQFFYLVPKRDARFPKRRVGFEKLRRGRR